MHPQNILYYVLRSGRQFGPYTEEQLRRFVAERRVFVSDLSWREGLTEWMPLSHLLPFDLPAAPQSPAPRQVVAIQPGPATHVKEAGGVPLSDVLNPHEVITQIAAHLTSHAEANLRILAGHGIRHEHDPTLIGTTYEIRNERWATVIDKFGCHQSLRFKHFACKYTITNADLMFVNVISDISEVIAELPLAALFRQISRDCGTDRYSGLDGVLYTMMAPKSRLDGSGSVQIGRTGVSLTVNGPKVSVDCVYGTLDNPRGVPLSREQQSFMSFEAFTPKNMRYLGTETDATPHLKKIFRQDAN